MSADPRPLVVHMGQVENAVQDARSQEPPHTRKYMQPLRVTIRGAGAPLEIELQHAPALTLLAFVWRLVRRDRARVVPS